MKLGRRPGRACAGPGGARIRRAPRRPAARPRRPRCPRPARPVRGLAAVLRAPRRHLSGRARVRGSPVGRREPARLHRVPARVVARLAALRDRTRPPRARRAPAGLGCGAAQLHVAPPRPAPGRGDGGSCSTGLVPGLPPQVRDRSSLAPRASRSTRSRRCGCCSTAACSCRTAPSTGPPGRSTPLEVPETLHALIAARLDGLPVDERRLLQDAAVLGKTFTTARSTRSPARAMDARAAARVARAQGGARRPGRPAVARARPVRLPAGPRPPRRLRDALQA